MPAMTSRTKNRRAMNEINMVPFIDVMLVLLIIFMVTAPLITPSMIDLPSVSKAPRQPDRVLQVLLRKDQSLSIQADGQERGVTAQALAQEVLAWQTAAPDTAKPSAAGGSNKTPQTSAVVISADKQIAYEHVVKVMDTLQRAGITRVGLSVQMQ